MSDIRSFFAPKGGAAPAKKPAPKPAEPIKKGRGRPRKVVEDSDDDAEDEPPVQPKKAAKPAPKKEAAPAVKGEDITADDYFTAAQKSTTPKKPSPKKPTPQAPVRQSPRAKTTTAANGKSTGKPKATTTSYGRVKVEDDEDAYMDDGDEDADDIFAAAAKGGNKRKNDDYAEEESEEEFLPKPKRIASRGKPAKVEDSDNEEDEEDIPLAPPKKKATNVRKRKSPESDDEDEEKKAPRKKTVAAKPRATPKKKKEPEPENTDFQALLDSIPTIRPPTPEPQEPSAKFNFKKNAGPAPMEGTVDIPEGAENCLMGMTFVFTGQLKTLGREQGQELIKRYGGKVTGGPSKKTTFVVMGDDAGPSKIKKINEIGIKTIDEHGLFELIRRTPANGGSGHNAEKVKEKQEKDQKKIKEAAAALEEEEKARQAEAVAAQKKAAAARGVAAKAAVDPSAQLWTTKYAPTQLGHICGNKTNVEKIQKWLEAWHKSRKYDFQRRGADGFGGVRAVILSGPPGIGKTTAAHLAAKLAGYDVIESNASDSRSKKLVENGVTEVMTNTSLLGYFAGDGKKLDEGKKNIVLIMDEVDGMSAGDRGGVGALAKLCKKTEVPLILICNERKLPKMKPFDFVTTDIMFRRPTVDQVRSRIMTICHREGLKLPVQVVDALIEGSNKDIRQIINMLATIKLDQSLAESSINFDQTKSMSKAWEKHVVLKPWDICQKLLGGGLFGPASKATLNDKIELYFNDHEFSPLMIQENYLKAKPAGLGGKGYSKREENMKHLELIDQAAESISDGDLVDKMIHGSQQQWSLMPTHGVFSTVRPASFVSGMIMGTSFTSWLGNNSKTGKLSRFNREIHSHMRLKSSGDANEIRQQYLPVLWYQLIKRLSFEGKECIGDVIHLMDSYYLTRDDFDNLKELGVGPQAEGLVDIDTQTKAAFTRTYNSMSHPVPFMKASNITAPKKASKDVPDIEDAIEASDDEAEAAEPADEDDDEIDLKKDKLIKQPKAKAKRAPKKKAADEDEDEDGDSKTTKGRGKGKVPAKGKTKK